MTIAGNYLPRDSTGCPRKKQWFVEAEAGHRRAPLHAPSLRLRLAAASTSGSERLTLVLVHGLEGSSRSQYILGTAIACLGRWHATWSA
jgi:predicted alpha/beta-fold hydrolase